MARSVASYRIFASSLLLGLFASSVRAELLIGGILSSSGGPEIRRYSATGVDSGVLRGVNAEIIEDLAVDSLANVFCVNMSVGYGGVAVSSSAAYDAGDFFPQQLTLPSSVVAGWKGHLFATSQYFQYAPASVQGVLELDPSLDNNFLTSPAFVQNAIPFPTSTATYPQWLAFDESFAGLPGVVEPGYLYVGDSGNSTKRYRQLSTGAQLDTVFAISAAGEMAFKHNDPTVFLANSATTISRYSSTTGASLGVFVTLPSGVLRDFTFADDNSLFVLSYANGTHSGVGTVHHYDPNGTLLGSFTTPSMQYGAIAFVPEPMAMGPLILILLPFLRRARRASP